MHTYSWTGRPNCGSTVHHFHIMQKGGFDKQDEDKTM